jgi:hypothetical protein
MEPKMSAKGQLQMGKVMGSVSGQPDVITRGALSMERCARDLSGPRRHDPPDPYFDREVAGIYASWKSRDGAGRYASRAIANAAQRLQFPARLLDRHLEDAVLADVPLDRIRELGRALIRRVDVLAARHRRLKPAA